MVDAWNCAFLRLFHVEVHAGSIQTAKWSRKCPGKCMQTRPMLSISMRGNERISRANERVDGGTKPRVSRRPFSSQRSKPIVGPTSPSTPIITNLFIEALIIWQTGCTQPSELAFNPRSCTSCGLTVIPTHEDRELTVRPICL